MCSNYDENAVAREFGHVEMMQKQREGWDGRTKISALDKILGVLTTSDIEEKVVDGRYDVMESCNKCGGLNDVTPTDVDGYTICEAETICTVCGFKDYWAYGHFESRLEMFSKCEKY